MIFAKSTTYTINPEKMKPFLDYLFVLTKKVRMLELNLSFEYGIADDDKIVLVERWSSKQSYDDFAKIDEFKKELDTLAKMSKTVVVNFELTTVK
ncbi:antibiotic biosynthesis monooxygenase family protein [Mycoplasma corogypsi]|uniref:antibiotic biosynthesis monooxygenase family protein n=1 Tax=Mycoplasma corogypsi TaxID=2106 RepID=UPI0038736DC9